MAGTPDEVPKALDELIESLALPTGEAEVRARVLLEDLSRLRGRVELDPTLRAVVLAYGCILLGKMSEALEECRLARALWPVAKGE